MHFSRANHSRAFLCLTHWTAKPLFKVSWQYYQMYSPRSSGFLVPHASLVLSSNFRLPERRKNEIFSDENFFGNFPTWIFSPQSQMTRIHDASIREMTIISNDSFWYKRRKHQIWNIPKYPIFLVSHSVKSASECISSKSDNGREFAARDHMVYGLYHRGFIMDENWIIRLFSWQKIVVQVKLLRFDIHEKVL